MYSYAIEDFLFDVYYPTEVNTVTLEGISISDIIEKIIRIGKRFIEIIKTHIIDRIKRWLTRIRNSKNLKNGTSILVPMSVDKVVSMATDYAKVIPRTLEWIRIRCIDLFHAAQKDNPTGDPNNKTDENVRKAQKILAIYQDENFTKEECERFEELYQAAESTSEKPSKVLSTSSINGVMNSIASAIPNAEQLLTKIRENISAMEAASHKNLYMTPSEFTGVLSGIGIGERIVMNISRILLTSEKSVQLALTYQNANSKKED